VLIVYNWLDNNVLLPNHVKTVLLGHFLMHSLACYFSFGLLKFQKFPFVLMISAVNLITFFYAPSILDPIDFQLGTLNYPILNDLFLGYLIFYTTYFFILHRSLNVTNRFITQNVKIVYRLDALKRLKQELDSSYESLLFLGKNLLENDLLNSAIFNIRLLFTLYKREENYERLAELKKLVDLIENSNVSVVDKKIIESLKVNLN
jgi:hypothetical protein